MIGKLIGAIAGAKAAETTGKVGGAGGAILGAISVAALRRLSLPALIVLGAGGYAIKRLSDKSGQTSPEAKPKANPAAA